MFDPDVEKIMTLEPDLVVATRDGNPKRVIEFLEKTGIPCFVIEPQTMEKILQAIGKIALLVGSGSSSMERINILKAEYRSIKRAGSEKPPRVLFLVSPSPLMGAGKGTFIDEIIRFAGGENVLSSSVVEYPHLQVEDIVSYAPELIFYVTRMGFLGGEGLLKKIESILGDGRPRFIPLDPDIYTRPGPRLFKGLKEMRGYIGGGSK
jgi:iron complex transport system substrate-binding protein